MLYLKRLEKIRTRLEAVEKELSDPEVVKDQANYQKLMKESAKIRPIVECFDQFLQIEKEEAATVQGLEDPDLDAEMKKLYEEELDQLRAKKETTQQKLEELLVQESDANTGRDVIIEIRAGTGVDEAALFAGDLYRMYTKFATNHKLKSETISSNPTGKGGFKEMILSISGLQAYSLFKYESGIHRVQRVPETESSGRIHTSAVTVATLVEADDSEIEIETKDLRIDVFRASGAGGQHVNKTESAVRITHIPTGFVVSCQDERSQHKNKAKAMRVLRARIYEMTQAKLAKEQAQERKQQVGSGDRSGKIRTYNFLERRVTDHRIGLTLHELDDILGGSLDKVIRALAENERTQKLVDSA